jgi:hypothetical protein
MHGWMKTVETKPVEAFFACSQSWRVATGGAGLEHT